MVEEEWQTYRPTYEQFKDLKGYIESLEKQGAHLAGILKIVPPNEWVPRSAGYNLEDLEFKIDTPIQQKLIPIPGKDGVYRSQASRLSSLTPKQYSKLAHRPQYVAPEHSSYSDLEKKYWESQTNYSSFDPVYGADVNFSLTDDTIKAWNVSKLDSILSDGIQGDDVIPGVNNSYLYFGMWRATFSWHVEDMDLYATNYLHYGAPKTWYCVPPSQAHLLERLAGQLYPDWKKLCFNFMRHKICMIDPSLLRRHGITVNKMVQEERNFIVVFPHAFHAGFNHGFNIAEAANFALPRWVEYGKRFRSCCCSMWISAVDGMRLSMDYFMKTYQPDRYLAWKEGKDYGPHPEDPTEVKQFFSELDLSNLPEEQLQLLKKMKLVLDHPDLKEIQEVSADDQPLPAPVRDQPLPSSRYQLNQIQTSQQESCTSPKPSNQVVSVSPQGRQHNKTRDIKRARVPRNTRPGGKTVQGYKKLGRPRKIRNKENEDESVSDSVKRDKEEVATTDSEPAPKRRRGRPKKGEERVKVTAKPITQEEKAERKKQREMNREEKQKKQEEKEQKREARKKQRKVKKFGFVAMKMEDLESRKEMFTCRKKHKFLKCKKCPGCLHGDCGECLHCLDKKKFGGPEKLRQKCEKKLCENPTMSRCSECTWSIAV